MKKMKRLGALIMFMGKRLEEMLNLYFGKRRMANQWTDYENNHFQQNKVENLVIKQGIIGNDKFVWESLITI